MTGMISCNDAIKELWRYLDGTVDETNKAKLDEHLTFCRRCCGEVEFIEELNALLARSSDEIPVDIQARLLLTLDGLEAQL